jgi:uncharacterized protein (TIGR02594 family)
MALSTAKLKAAVKYNNENGDKVGWVAYYQQTLSVLGFQNICPIPEKFAQAVADWQDANGLDDDGKLGPNTWKKMKLAAGIKPKLSPKNSSPLALSGSGPIWLQVAQAERNHWDTAIAGMSKAERKIAEFHMTRDEEYFMASPYFGGKVKEPGVIPKNASRLHWCAAFVNWCLHRSGYSHTGNAGANSFTKRSLWRFDALREPKQGCVIVVGQTSGAHVGFLWESSGLPENPRGDVSITKGRKLRLLGGNQSQRITVNNEKRKMLSARGQNGVVSPYFWPTRGQANCNHVPGTEEGHYCGSIHS